MGKMELVLSSSEIKTLFLLFYQYLLYVKGSRTMFNLGFKDYKIHLISFKDIFDELVADENYCLKLCELLAN